MGFECDVDGKLRTSILFECHDNIGDIIWKGSAK